MFNKTKNLETAFRAMRVQALVVIVGCLLFSLGVLITAVYMVMKSSGTVYVLSADKALQAFAMDGRADLAVEAKAQVIALHELFFNLDPDDELIERNIHRALYLADGSALRVYNNLKESGYYGEVVSANISQRVAIDSVVLVTSMLPFYFKVFATETIIRTSSVATRSLVTEGYLREVGRSEHNAHGLLIERWSVLENKDEKVIKR